MAAPIYDDLAEMFPDEVTIEPFIGADRYGKPEYTSPFTVAARVIGRTRMALDADGQERVSNIQAVLKGFFGATPQDRYTVPARFSLNPLDPTDIEARQPRALAVDKETDENGAHHETVYFSTSPRNRGF